MLHAGILYVELSDLDQEESCDSTYRMCYLGMISYQTPDPPPFAKSIAKVDILTIF